MKLKIKNNLIWGYLNKDGTAAKGSLINAIQELDKFTFNSGKVRYNLTRNLQHLEAEFKLIEDTRAKLTKETSEEQKSEDENSKDGIISGKWLEQLINKLNEVLDTEVEVEIRQIPLSSLDLDKNNIPIRVLDALLDLVVTDDMPA